MIEVFLVTALVLYLMTWVGHCGFPFTALGRALWRARRREVQAIIKLMDEGESYTEARWQVKHGERRR